MNPIRRLNDALHAIDRSRRRHPFEFWSGVYLLIFLGPVAWMIISDLVLWYAPITPGTAVIGAMASR